MSDPEMPEESLPESAPESPDAPVSELHDDDQGAAEGPEGSEGGDDDLPPPAEEKKLTGESYEAFHEALDILYIKGNMGGRINFTRDWPAAALHIFGEELIAHDTDGSPDLERRAALEEEALDRRIEFLEVIKTLEEKSVIKDALQKDYVENLVRNLGRELSLLLYDSRFVDPVLPPTAEEKELEEQAAQEQTSQEENVEAEQVADVAVQEEAEEETEEETEEEALVEPLNVSGTPEPIAPESSVASETVEAVDTVEIDDVDQIDDNSPADSAPAGPVKFDDLVKQVEDGEENKEEQESEAPQAPKS